MTREEASYILRKFYADGYKSNNYNALEIALKIAVICLENLPHWISVEDELPPIGGIVLVAIPLGGELSVLPLSIKNESDFECLSGMTHWMPLPQAPKEGSELSNGKEIEIECDYE